MATLQGKAIKDTYKDLLQVSSTNNTGVTSAMKTVEDGEGTSSALGISTTEVKITGDLEVTGSVTGVPHVDYRGNYSGSTAYVKDDVVFFNGSSYIAKQSSTGNAPTNTTYWGLLAQKGTDGVTPPTPSNGVDGVDGVDGDDGDDGLGFTGGSYDASTGVVTFTSNDGLGFSTGDLRAPDPVADGLDGPVSFLGGESATSNEGGQLYLGFPRISHAKQNADPEGNNWSIDCYYDANNFYHQIPAGLFPSPLSDWGFPQENDALLRIFSPLTRGGLGFSPVLIGSKGEMKVNGLINMHKPFQSVSRASASAGDVLLKGAYNLSSITEGNSFTATNMHSSNPGIYSPNSNAGLRFMSEAYHTANNNTGGFWDQFVDYTTNAFEIYQGSVRVLTLFANGNANLSGLLTQNSDERVKKDIADLDSAEQSVAQVLKGKIKKFRRTDDNDQKLRFGVIAQEVESAFSDAGLNVSDYSIVTEEKNYAKVDSNGKFTDVIGAGYPETNLDIRKKVTLNDGTEYIGVTNEHTDLDEAEQVGESFVTHQTLVIQEGSEEHVILENSDIKTTEVLPPVGYEEVMLKSVDYGQLNAFIISAL